MNKASKARCLWLHIGMPKTGTSFLQAMMVHNRAALRGQGWLYPNSGLLGPGHALLAFPYLTPARSERADVAAHEHAEPAELWRGIAREQAADPAERLMLSSEYFSEIEDLSDFAVGCRGIAEQIKVVVYLRRQDRLIEAGYNQGIKSGTRAVPFRFPKRYDPSKDYGLLLARFGEAFGRESLIPRLFESALANGLTADFRDATGLDLTGLPERDEGRNERLHSSILRFRYIENTLGLEDSDLFARVNPYLFKSPAFPMAAIMTPAQRLELLKRYQESNARVAREYFGFEDGVLFDIEGLKRRAQEPATKADALAAAISVAWHETRQEIDTLRAEVAVLREELAKAKSPPG